MPQTSDPASLLREQYRDDSNLRARYNLHARFSTNPCSFHRWVFDHVSLAPGDRLLEVGCGPGSFWVTNSDRLPAQQDVTLTDLSGGMLDAARSGLAPFGFAPALAAVDAQTLPFASETFATVIANHMLYHVPDRERALGEIRRVLRPDGALYAATNGPAHMHEIFDVLGGRLYSLESFDLDTGADQLRRSFSRVTLARYQNALAITEVQPLIDYVRSTQRGRAIAGPLEQLRVAVERAIASEGAFHVTTDAGLLMARRDG